MTEPLPPADTAAEPLIEAGRAKLYSGDRAGALALFERAVALAPHNEQAWLYLAAAQETEVERRRCLQQALASNPTSVLLREELDLTRPSEALQSAPAALRPPTAPLPLAPVAGQAHGPVQEVSARQPSSRVAPSAPGDEAAWLSSGLSPVVAPGAFLAPPPAQQSKGWLNTGRALFRAVPAALYALVLMVFFLPFVTVACGSVRESYSGVDLISDNIEFEGAGWLGERLGLDMATLQDASARTPAIAAFLSAVVGLVATGVPHWAGRVVAAAASLSGVGSLLVLRAGIERQLARPPLEGFVVVSFESGYWGALLLFALALAASLLILAGERSGRRHWG